MPDQVAAWQAADGGVLLLSYDLLRSNRSALLQGAAIVVADEAHVLRNGDTQVRCNMCWLIKQSPCQAW
jgi:hypothetical protein